MGDIFAIGDIHGCFDQLTALMEQIDGLITPEADTLVFLGDYIDRGPASFEVVDYLIRLKARFPHTVFLKGNHEEMLEHYLSGQDKYTYVVNGGRQTLDSYLTHQPPESDAFPIPPDHLEFFSSLRLYYQTEDYVFVHAGLRAGVPLEMQTSEDLLWIRGAFLRSDYDFGKQVVFGHTPVPNPLIQPNKIGIDTGAVYGNRLTCVRLPQLDFFHAYTCTP